MSFLKGFLPSFIISLLVFSVIILYGGSFALSLLNEDIINPDGDGDNVDIGGDGNSSSASTTQNIFSFALAIIDRTEAPIPDTASPEESDGNEGDGEETDVPNEGNEGDTDTDSEEEDDQTPEYIKNFDSIIKDDSIKLKYTVKFVCVVSINASAKKSFVTVIPGDSITTIGGTDLPLTYALYFADNTSMNLSEYLPNTVCAMTGIMPDFYGLVDIDDFVMLADELGDLKYDNQNRITTYIKGTEEKLTVPKGIIDLTSEKLSALLEYSEYSNKYTSSQILLDVSQIMLDNICAKYRPNIISKVRSMLEYVETDFTTQDMRELSSVFFSYTSSEKTFLPMLGAFENVLGGSYFRANIASIEKFKEFLN